MFHGLRASQLQQDIETWQYRNKVTISSLDEMMELSQRAQIRFARYNQSVMRRRINMHRMTSRLGQASINSVHIENIYLLQY